MNWRCTFGLHEWDGCTCRLCARVRDYAHAWNGCMCSKCAAVRDCDHDFDDDFRCTICGKQTLCEVCGGEVTSQNVHESCAWHTTQFWLG